MVALMRRGLKPNFSLMEKLLTVSWNDFPDEKGIETKGVMNW